VTEKKLQGWLGCIKSRFICNYVKTARTTTATRLEQLELLGPGGGGGSCVRTSPVLVVRAAEI
jgi:hypothetical protein